MLVLLANYFSTAGHKVYVIANKPCVGEYRLSSSADKRYIDSDVSSKEGLLRRNVRRAKFIRRLCKEKRIDCMVSFMAEPNIRCILACLGLKTKNIISVRNDPQKEYPGKMMFAARGLFRLADGAVFQTKRAAMSFRGLKERACVIPNPIDGDFFDARANLASTRIVTAGRLEGQKNHELLIRAFSNISQEHSEFTLDIFGEGSLREHLQGVAEECGVGQRVLFHGRSNQMAQELSDAAVFVLSSDYEGMPNALMEAMAVGVPAVSTDCPCGGPSELIDSGVNGLLVPVGDMEEMSHSISKVLDDRDLASSISASARASMTRYGNESICELWLQAVERCLA